MKWIFLSVIVVMACNRHITNNNSSIKEDYYYSLDNMRLVVIKDTAFTYYSNGIIREALCWGKVLYENDTMQFLKEGEPAGDTLSKSKNPIFFKPIYCDSIEKVVLHVDTLYFKSQKFVRLKK